MNVEEIQSTVPEFFQGRKRHAAKTLLTGQSHWSNIFCIYKVTFDLTLAVLALPLIALVALFLMIVNPWLNLGPLLFVQERLGRHRIPFRIYKFRTMSVGPTILRSIEDAVEHDRITPFSKLLRSLRIDELPNFINVLRGDMSVIGPRPDAVEHAEKYLKIIPHYGFRFLVKPGITGLAQIESGYAEGIDATTAKAHYDQLYVETSCGRLDVYIAWRTIRVVLTGFGAK